MNETQEDLQRLAAEILTVQENLDARVFDRHGKIYDLLRRRLLHRADYMAQETIGKIDGIEVGDVVLLGSSASYFYRPASDLDVKIEAVNKSCPYLPAFTASEDGFTKYLSLLGAAFFSNHKKFFIGNRFVDMKLTSKVWDYAWTGIYSLVQDKWLVEPRKDIAQGFTTETLLDCYHDRCREIDEFMASFSAEGEKYSQEQCDQMFHYYQTQVLDKNQTIEDYFTFKMIKATGKLKNFGGKIFAEQMKTLSF